MRYAPSIRNPKSLMDLYQKLILEHFKNPHNFGELSGERRIGERNNPVCGDEVKVMLRVDDQGNVGEIQFTARGCALSIASASMMTELARGKSLEAVREMIAHVSGVFQGQFPPAELERYGELAALRGVLEHPVRIKCVLLCWQALEEALGQEGG